MCTPGRLAAASTEVQALRTRLNASIPPGASGDVPVPMQHNILALKNGIVSATDAWMGCETAATLDVRSLQKAMDAANLDVKLRMASGSPPWLLASSGFTFPCADDNLLWVYAYRNGRWRRILRAQRGAYASILNAWGDFFVYRVIPASDGHGRRIVLAHGNPWCTSRYSGFEIDVIEPDGDADSARRVFHAGAAYSRGEGSPRLRVVPAGFALQLQVCTLTNPDMCGTRVFRYRVEGDGYVRVQPVALDPLDFLGAWLNVGWPEASQWSAPVAAGALREAHKAIHGGVDEGKYASMQFSYGDTYECPNGKFQVALRFQAQRAKETSGEHSPTLRYFFIRDDEADQFTLLSSATQPDPACTRKVSMRSQ